MTKRPIQQWVSAFLRFMAVLQHLRNKLMLGVIGSLALLWPA